MTKSLILLFLCLGTGVTLADYNLTVEQAKGLVIVHDSIEFIAHFNQLKNGYYIAVVTPSKTEKRMMYISGSIEIDDQNGHRLDLLPYDFSTNLIRGDAIYWDPYCDYESATETTESNRVLLWDRPDDERGTLKYGPINEYLDPDWYALIPTLIKPEQLKTTDELLKKKTLEKADFINLLINFQLEQTPDRLIPLINSTKSHSASILVSSIYEALLPGKRRSFVAKLVTQPVADDDLYYRTLGILGSLSFKEAKHEEQHALVAPLKKVVQSPQYPATRQLLTACGQ